MMALTRRALLEQIGTVGDLGAAYMAMEMLGLAIPTPARAENFQLPRASGTGRSVVILGAGIAGLVSAYELRRAGCQVTVLEARDRIGWGQTPWSSGVGVLWADGPRGGIERGARYAELLKPERPIVFAGEHLSYQGQWQEGAALSAHEALKLVQAMAMAKAA
jgi:monoamine oxidase